MAKWLVMPSLNYTGDFDINTDYEESIGDPKTYYIEILTSVLHSKKAAEKAFIFDYNIQGTTEYGFQATLSNDQANSLSGNPHVHSVVGANTLLPVDIKNYVIYTKKPNKDPVAYYTEILKSSVGSEERVKETWTHNLTGTFTAVLPSSPSFFFCGRESGGVVDGGEYYANALGGCDRRCGFPHRIRLGKLEYELRVVAVRAPGICSQKAGWEIVVLSIHFSYPLSSSLLFLITHKKSIPETSIPIAISWS
nr:subtilisin-like protease SBT3.16 [Ipomoea batatas]